MRTYTRMKIIMHDKVRRQNIGARNMNRVRRCMVFLGNVTHSRIEDEKKETLVRFMRAICARNEFADKMREVQVVVGYLQFRSRNILA